MSESQDTVGQAKADIIRAKDRVVKLLNSTPSDRLNWSPSPSARTPLQIGTHVADAVKHIHGFLDGRPFPAKSPEEADKQFREYERQFTTREQVVGLLEDNCANYVAWLDRLTPEQLNSAVELPFGMGSAPVSLGLTFAPGHTNGHIGQLEYLQTVYGDLDWHM